ncbi:MAG: SpoIID/LytB domain-containing protein [Bacteroidales bacterium]
MKRLVWLMILWFLVPGLRAQTVRVGLFQDHLVTSLVVYCSAGQYLLDSGEDTLTRMAQGDILYLTLEEGGLKVLDSQRDFGRHAAIRIRQSVPGSVLRIRSVKPELESRTYDDDLYVEASDRFMTLVNEVDLDKYLAGVVETEAGTGAHPEFYKAQAILCRTFVIRHLDRHKGEGFSLCDGTHCQAYHGRSVSNPEILEAVLESSGRVVTDFNYKLITAAYHSNSGGQTQRASDVWLSDEEYLQSVVDPYSLHQPNAKWQDTISFAEWKDYLIRNGMKSVPRIPEEILYVEQMRRKKYFVLDKDSLRMSKIREDWGFKSAYFDMFPQGDSVLVWGKGYGHGIGLSQEGAMKMARDGFNHEDILQFYFFGIRIMDYRDLPDSSLPEGGFDQRF